LKKILLILLAVANFAWAETTDWTADQRIWAATAGTLLLADWATTRYGSRHWDQGYYETNVLLGSQPSTQRVDLHFLMFVPAIFLLADSFPEQRELILKIVSGVELVAVGNNLHVGWKINF
jgi:hypothetical protein